MREFRKEEVVARDGNEIKSALRSKPSTPGRLVKLNVIEEPSETTNDSAVVSNGENCGSESDRLETQSGDCACSS